MNNVHHASSSRAAFDACTRALRHSGIPHNTDSGGDVLLCVAHAVPSLVVEVVPYADL